MADVTVDTKAVNELAQEIKEAQRALLGRAAERGYQLLREEVPYETGNLRQGVAPPDVDYARMQATLTVSARSARTGGGVATLHLKSGKTRQVSLRSNPAFNYAEAVAKGRPSISPKRAKALLIPVSSAPVGESYLTANGKIYIVRPQAKATKPNPFDERAAQRLEREIPAIAEAVLREFFE